MSNSRLFSLYSRLPVWSQNVACTLAGFRMKRERYNKRFWKSLDFLQQSQKWSLAEQQAYQDEQLRGVIKHAYETVPYYREVMEARRLVPADIRCTGDLSMLPVLDKKTIRERFADLISRGWPRKRQVVGHTGGTT